MMQKTQRFNKCFCVEFTCHKVPKSNSSQGDDHKIEGLQRRPALDVFKDGCWERDKQQAAKKHKQQRGYDPDLCLSDVPVLQGRLKNKGSITKLTTETTGVCKQTTWRPSYHQLEGVTMCW